MLRKKEYTDSYTHKGRMRIAIGLLILLAICILARLTPIINFYWINLLTALIVDSAFSIIVIAGLLIAIHFVELKRYQERLREEGKEDVD